MLQWTLVCFCTSAATTELHVKFIMSSSTDRSDAWIVWLSCEFCGRSICSFCTLFSLNALCQEKHLSQNTLNFQRKSKVVSNLLDIFAAYAHSWRAAPGEALLNPNMSVQWCSHPNLKKKPTKQKTPWKISVALLKDTKLHFSCGETQKSPCEFLSSATR